MSASTSGFNDWKIESGTKGLKLGGTVTSGREHEPNMGHRQQKHIFAWTAVVGITVVAALCAFGNDPHLVKYSLVIVGIAGVITTISALIWSFSDRRSLALFFFGVGLISGSCAGLLSNERPSISNFLWSIALVFLGTSVLLPKLLKRLH
jgi:hypothetical protein